MRKKNKSKLEETVTQEPPKCLRQAYTDIKYLNNIHPTLISAREGKERKKTKSHSFHEESKARHISILRPSLRPVPFPSFTFFGPLHALNIVTRHAERQKMLAPII